MGDGPPYTIWMLGDDDGVGGAMPPPMDGMPSFWGVYFSVEDTDATVAKAKGLGANVLAEPMDIPDVGRFAALDGPAGRGVQRDQERAAWHLDPPGSP